MQQRARAGSQVWAAEQDLRDELTRLRADTARLALGGRRRGPNCTLAMLGCCCPCVAVCLYEGCCTCSTLLSCVLTAAGIVPGVIYALVVTTGNNCLG